MDRCNRLRLLGPVLPGLTNDFVVKWQNENKDVENIYWLLSWETVQQEVVIVWVMRHRSLQSEMDRNSAWLIASQMSKA